MYCDRLELFADFNYTQAGGRHHSYKTSDVSLASKEKIGHYRAYDFYLGTRYYLFPVFSNLTPFFGGKVGLVTRDKIRGSTRTVVADTSGVGHKHTHFRSDTTISGGLHAGVNWDLSANLSVTLKAEAIWSGDWRPTVDREEGSSTSVVETPVSLPIIVHGKTGPILSVPVTLGIRYAF
ncbi:hypothetical protein [Parachlamydia sp. AcF125]|uniref:hypothetical protein n=1 Tax=Parachlamydia sp. AcF125 TaxID=2795736 RepID=UPI0020165449|nr:hypothetical protein [Parachlamydia sp. AcF125]